MQKFTTTITTIADPVTKAVSPLKNAQVFLYQGSTNNLAVLYQDNESGTRTNPLITDDNGFVECKLANGTYDIWVVAGGVAKKVTGFCAFDGSQSAVTITMPPQFAVSGGTNVAWNPQAAKRFLAGPLTGADAAPTFRAIAATDLPAASGSAAGIVQLSDATAVKGGTDASTASTPAAILGALGLSAFYESPLQVIANGGPLTLAHGLGRKPVLIVATVVCQTAELGYSVGDEVFINTMSGNNTSCGFNCVVDTTNLNIRYGAAFFGAFQSKSNGVQSSTTLANWRFRIRAWA